MGKIYNHHIEFIRNKPDTHPQTGESKPRTIVDVYIHDDSFDVWGWGWVNTYRPNTMTLEEITAAVTDVMRKDGFHLTYSDGDKELLAPDGPADDWNCHLILTRSEAQDGSGEQQQADIYLLSYLIESSINICYYITKNG